MCIVNKSFVDDPGIPADYSFTVWREMEMCWKYFSAFLIQINKKCAYYWFLLTWYGIFLDQKLSY